MVTAYANLTTIRYFLREIRTTNCNYVAMKKSASMKLEQELSL